MAVWIFEKLHEIMKKYTFKKLFVSGVMVYLYFAIFPFMITTGIIEKAFCFANTFMAFFFPMIICPLIWLVISLGYIILEFRSFTKKQLIMLASLQLLLVMTEALVIKFL